MTTFDNRKDFPQHPWVAASLDFCMRPMRRLRPKLLAAASGRVLEVGCGTGMNFDCYAGIESLAAVEPDPHMLRRARVKAEGLPYPARLEQAGAEDLPFDDDSFDTAVLTWVLCTIAQPQAAVAEVLRVLRPGGRLIYAEHTRAKGRLAASMQDGLTPLWKKLAGGCHLNRDSVAMLAEAGFVDFSCRPAGSESWNLVPVYTGTATKPYLP